MTDTANSANWDIKEIKRFEDKNGLTGLTELSISSMLDNRDGYSIEKGIQFLRFHKRINAELLKHEVITSNPFTAWFKQGEQNYEQVKAFIVQFSVFSNLFLIAQLYKTINADSLESMRASKEILANEIGVVFKPLGKTEMNPTDTEAESDPALVSAKGTVEGGTFRFRAAHFEWLLQIAYKLGLQFHDVGKRGHGTEDTLFFCDVLKSLYGNEDYMISQAASYAVENWAAAGFWDELVEGFEKFNKRTGMKLPLAFFKWHSLLEAQHALHTKEELEDLYFSCHIDEDRFIGFGNAMLDGVRTFWEGLNDQRKKLV